MASTAKKDKGTQTVEGANGTQTTVPNSAVTPPGDSGSPTYTGTVAPAAPLASLGKTAKRLFPSTTSVIGATEHKAAGKAQDKIAHLNDLIGVMKSLQDGTFDKKYGDPQADSGPIMQAILAQAGPSEPLDVQYWMQQGGNVTPAVRKWVQQQATRLARQTAQGIGISLGSANNYQSFQSALQKPENQTILKENTLAQGNRAPMAPFTRTQGLMDVLKALESPQALTGSRGEPNTLGLDASGQQVLNDLKGQLDVRDGDTIMSQPAYRQALETLTVGNIRQHLKDMGVDPEDAYTSQQLNSLTVPSSLHTALATDGFKLGSTTTIGTLFQTLNQQSIRGGIPGGVVGTPGAPTPPGTPPPGVPYQANMTGQQFMANFKQQWQSSAAFRQHTAAALTAASPSIGTAPGDKITDYNAAANAMIQILNQTPKGTDPYTYLNQQAGMTDTAAIHTNQSYALALALSDKIGANLSNDQLNRLATVYGDSTATGNEEAELEAIASMYHYDPNYDAPPDSYAATMLTDAQDEYGKYGLSLTTPQVGKLVQTMLQGEMTGEGLRGGGADLTSIYSAGDAATAFAENQAKKVSAQLFPSLAPLIQEGDTLTGTGGVLSPYTTLYAQMLGTDPDTVLGGPTGGGQISLPDFIKLVTKGETGTAAGTDAASTGVAGVPTAKGGLKSLDEFQASVSQTPGWQKSSNAYEAYSNMANNIMSDMGFTPPSGQQNFGQPNPQTLTGGTV